MKKSGLIFVVSVFLVCGLYADVSPWDAWRLGYTCYEQGEGCRDRGEYTKALKAFQEALEHYNNVRRARPDWNQKVIARRIADCERETERMKRLLGDQEPSQEKMAESGAAMLRPAAPETAREMDDIRKKLSEATAELAALRQRTTAQRNYEQEITQLLRDRRVARERYMLLERRYRDLDQASRQPDRRTQEVREQLVEEKMRTEQLKKQLSAMERRRQADEKRFQDLENERRLLARKIADGTSESERLKSENAALKSSGKLASEKQRLLMERVEDMRRRLARLDQEKSASNDEIADLKQQLTAATARAAEADRASQREKELRQQIGRLDAERTSLRAEADKMLSQVEELKVKLIRVQVTESARQELERHVATQDKTLENLNRQLVSLKAENAGLRQKLTDLAAESDTETAGVRLMLSRKEKDVERLEKELAELRRNEGKQPSARLTALEAELAALRKTEAASSEKLLASQVDIKRLTQENETLREEVRKRAAASAAGTEELNELKKRLQAAESAAAQSRTLLERNLAAHSERSRRDAEIIAARNAEIGRLRTALEEKERETARTEEASRLAEASRKLNSDVQRLRDLLREKEGTIAEISLERDTLRKQNEELTGTAAVQKTASEKLTADIASLKAGIERERAAAETVAAELRRTRELKAEIEQDLKGAVDRAARLEKRLSNRDSEDFRRLTASQEERKALADKAAALQNEIVRLKAESESLRQGGDAARSELARVNAEHTRVVAERNRLQEDAKKQLAAIGKLGRDEKLYLQLKKDFAALQAENRENKLLVEAAKPREAELAQIKLRLAELDQLKAQLAREQQMNEELRNSNRRLESERGNAIMLRSRLNNANKRIGELEPLVAEVAELKKLNSELAKAKNLEADLAQARAQLTGFEAVRAELEQSRQRIRKLELENLEAVRKAAHASNLATGTQLLSSELEAARKAADELAKDKALRELELARLRTQLNAIPRLEAEIRSLRGSRTSGDPAFELELQQLRRKAQESSILSRTADEKSREAEDLKKQLGLLRDENSKLRLRAAESVRLSEIVRKLSGVNEEIRRDLPAASGDLAALKHRIAILEADASALKQAKEREKQAILQAEARDREIRALRAKETRVDRLESENEILRRQNRELEKLDEVRKALIDSRREIERLKSRAESAGKLQKLWEKAETAAAEKQAALDRSQRELASVSQLRSDLLAQKQENASIRLSLTRVKNEFEQLKMRAGQIDVLKRELERQKLLTRELASAKRLEGELARAKLRLAEFEQIKKELARVTKYNNELTEVRQRLEKELASRVREEKLPFEMVTQITAGKPEDFIASGKIAEADGSFELAVWNYEQALKIDRSNVQASLRLGRILLARQNFKRAVELLSVARAADPVDAALACDTARAYIGVKRYGNALAILSPLAERNGENYLVQLLLGKALAGSGDNRGAEARLRIAVRQAPPRVFEPRLELAKFLLATDVRRTEEAATIYEAARVAGAAPDIELEPKLGGRLDERREVSGFLSTAAREAERGGDWKTAGWYYRQLVELGREKDKYLPRLAFAQYRGNDPHGALETLTFNKTTPLSALVTALIQLSSKEYPAMLVSARKAVALNGGKPVLLPADWSEFPVEFERLKTKHSPEMADALRRAFRVSR